MNLVRRAAAAWRCRGQEWVWTTPGNKVGPFRSALQARFDADSDRRQGICYDDYAGNAQRIFITPIIESFDVNGKKLVRIVKFAAFFLKDRPGGSMATQGVRGQFINYVVPGNGGPNPPPDSKIYGNTSSNRERTPWQTGIV